ncbi:hypothetical protein FQZ97_827550 [compost metagenome]
MGVDIFQTMRNCSFTVAEPDDFERSSQPPTVLPYSFSCRVDRFVRLANQQNSSHIQLFNEKVDECSNEFRLPCPRRSLQKRQRSVVQQLDECLSLLFIEANLVSMLVLAVVSGEILLSDRNIVWRCILVARGVEQIEQVRQDPLSIKQSFKRSLPLTV